MEIEKDFGGILEEKKTLSNRSKDYLMEIAKWSKFFGIIGFVFVGLIALLSIFAGAFMSTMGGGMSSAFEEAGVSNPYAGFAGAGFTFVYLLVALLYFFPSLYIIKSSKAMKLGLKNNDDEQLEEGFKNLKSTFKFWGVFTAIFVGIYAVIFGFGIIGALIAAIAS